MADNVSSALPSSSSTPISTLSTDDHELVRRAADLLRESAGVKGAPLPPVVAVAVADWLDRVNSYGWILCGAGGCSDAGCSDCAALLPAHNVARAVISELGQTSGGCDTCDDTGRVPWTTEGDPSLYQEPDEDRIPCPDCVPASRAAGEERGHVV